MALIQTLKRRPVLTYFVLVYVLSWACWIPLAISKTRASSFPFLVLATLGISMPSLLGILLTALYGGSSLGELFRRVGRVRVPLVWYAIVLLLWDRAARAPGASAGRPWRPGAAWSRDDDLHLLGLHRPQLRRFGRR